MKYLYIILINLLLTINCYGYQQMPQIPTGGPWYGPTIIWVAPRPIFYPYYDYNQHFYRPMERWEKIDRIYTPHTIHYYYQIR